MKKFLTISIFIFCIFLIFAKNNFIYIINDKEKIDFTNSFIEENEEKLNILFIIIQNKKKYFIFNEKKYGPYDEITLLKDINKNIIGIKAVNGKKLFFITTNCKFFGPFREIYKISVQKKENVFLYVKDWLTKKNILFLNGKNIGSYDKLIDFYYNAKEDFWFFSVKKGKKFFLLANNNPSGPYKSAPIIAYSKYNDTFWGYGVETGGKFYIVMSFEKVLGPYKKIEKIGFSDYSASWYAIVEEDNNGKTKQKILINNMQSFLNGKFKKFLFNKKGNMFVLNIMREDGEYILFNNGEIFGPVDEIKDIILGNEEGHNIFSYRQKDKWFVQLNGRKSISFQKSPQLLSSTNNSYLGYSYEKSNNYFIYFNKKKYGPFDSPVSRIICDDENIAFSIKKDKKYQFFYKEQYLGDFEEIGDSVLYKKDNISKIVFIAKKGGIWNIYKNNTMIVSDVKGFYPNKMKNKIYYFIFDDKKVKIQIYTIE